MAFADRLLALRTAKRLTQKALADAINTSDAYISALETGRKLPSYPATQAIARKLGCDVQDLWACVQRDKAAEAEHKAKRRKLAFISDNVDLLATAPADVRATIQSFSDDPEFLEAVLNLRKIFSSARRALVLQLLKEFAQDTD